MVKRKPTETVQVPVRMQERLRAALEKAAKERGEKTSLNSEVVRRLEDSFRLADMETILEDVKAKLALMGPALQKLDEAFAQEERLHEEYMSTLSDEDRAMMEESTRKAKLLVEARPSLAQRLKAEQRRREGKLLTDADATRDQVSALEAEAATRKAELVVEARHLSGNPNMLVDEALTYLAKRGNAKAEAILNELQHRTPIKPLKRA
jgi:hypothetical protein